jgi:thiol-disulfide isomerase/thioredoxin
MLYSYYMQSNIITSIFALLLACSPARSPDSAVGCTNSGNDDFVYAIDTVETGEPEYPFATWDDCSGKVGEHPCNFTLKDQTGQDWSLYEHHGKVIVLDFSTMWCGVCVTIASQGDQFTSIYGSENFVWATILIEDASGSEVSQGDLQIWTQQHSLTSPVLAGDRSLIDLTAEIGWPVTAWPTLVVIGKDMTTVHGQIGWNEDWMHQAVQTAL